MWVQEILPSRCLTDGPCVCVYVFIIFSKGSASQQIEKNVSESAIDRGWTSDISAQ